MRKRIIQIIKHPLLTGSSVVIIGSNLVNAVNYFYHLIMGRLLGPASYSELTVLISFIGLLAILPSAFGLVIINFISSTNKSDEIKGIINWFDKRINYLIILSFVVLLLSFKFIADFLKIDWLILGVFLISFFISLKAFLNKSVLQGILKFKESVFALLAETSLKLILGVMLVYAGFSVLGAAVGFALSALLGLIISFYYVNKFIKTKKAVVPETSGIIKYSFPVLIQSVSATLLISIDLILVKHFFSSHDAGLYAAISTLGKIIFFGSGPIAGVMFPLIPKTKLKGGNYIKIFLISMASTFLLSISIVGFYAVFPSLAINILYGRLYLEASSLLIWYALYITLINLSSLFVTFYLSLKMTRIVVFPAIAAILQAILIWFNHGSLLQVIQVSIFTSILLFVVLLSDFLIYRKRI